MEGYRSCYQSSLNSGNLLGNMSEELQAQLEARSNQLEAQNSQLESRISQLEALLAKDQVRGESSVMGGYNQFAELVLTSYTWTAVTGYSHVVTGYKRASLLIAKQFHALT